MDRFVRFIPAERKPICFAPLFCRDVSSPLEFDNANGFRRRSVRGGEEQNQNDDIKSLHRERPRCGFVDDVDGREGTQKERMLKANAMGKIPRIAFPFPRRWGRVPVVKFSRAPLRYLCAIILICAGAVGILFSPSVGLFGGKEIRSFTLNRTEQYSWGAVIASSELEIPFVQNRRGLVFMSAFLAGSLGAFFGGVHWYAALRRGVIQRG